MLQLRNMARAEPGTWHQMRTSRFGIYLGWKLDLDASVSEFGETLRVYREYVRPYSEDLIAVARRLPEDLEIAACRPIAADHVLLLPLRSRSSVAVGANCARCGTPQRPGFPIFGEESLCAVCATRPVREENQS